ncbi:hypothetical protein KBTX_02324 [wastewater metagenome]|uniref:Uncharacterized protein n=2 Tax=unclassified sequences TaxID=12908 RepID=A0A5B8RGL1_9ZZZZ|nr:MULTISPECIES: hypothetical protein [Arhodomonas]QEA05995.1 hypothetical protein KBTEX_02324 [uncultured organism]
MSQPFDVEGFIRSRKNTRTISELLRAQAADYLGTVSPLVKPQTLFGEYLTGAPRGSTREAHHNFKEFKTLYERHASGRPFSLMNELEVPLDLLDSTPTLYPLEHDHAIDGIEGTIRVLSPTRWVIGYSSFELTRFRRITRDANRSNSELHRFVVHYLMAFYCFSKAGGLGRLFKGLRFPVTFQTLDDFGEMPFCVINAPVAAHLPDDRVIRHSTEISGSRTFEELVSREDIDAMEDGVRTQLLQALASGGEQ